MIGKPLPLPTLPTLPSMRALRAFTLVAEQGSFVGAAARLGVSRSAVSHLVADLERQLGAPLFWRGPDGIRLTDEGAALLQGLREPIDRIESALAGFRRDQREVRLSTISTFASFWLIPRLPAFHAARPEVRVAVSTSVQVADFERSGLDCAIRHGRGGWDGLDSTLLFHESLVAVGLPSIIAAARPGELGGLLHETRVIGVSTRPDDLRTWWQGAGLDGPLPQPALTVETRAQAIAGALAGAGIALADPRLIQSNTQARTLAILPLPSVPLATGYHFVTPPRSRSRKNVQLLKQWVLAEAAREAVDLPALEAGC